MYRILVLVPFPMDQENLARREAQRQAVRLGPDMELSFRAVGIAPANYVSQQDALLADLGMIQAGLDAERQGYHAVCIDTVSDAGMAVLRSVLRIPVIGAGRHAVLTALMLGERFSFVSMWDRWRPLHQKVLADLGLAHKCASIRSADLTPNNQQLLGGREDEVFPVLLQVAQQCIDQDGADVIILGSTTMHEAHAYLAQRLPVPVINPGPLTYRMAQMALQLGLTHSAATYPQPLSPRLDTYRAMGGAVGH